MEIPRYWAEASARHGPEHQEPCTLTRFGWSAVSQEEAEAHARSRADEALRNFIAGDHELARRERRVAYSGADGLPIREEIVAEPLPNAVITRNSYGALCLNTSNVLFADMDQVDPSLGAGLAGCLGALAGGALAYWVGRDQGLVGSQLAVITLAGVLLAAFLVPRARRLWLRIRGSIEGSPSRAALRRVERWCEQRRDWNVRVYETPAGLRLLAMHGVFDPRGEAARTFLQHVRCDPIFLRMCHVQACFRARVSPKPWRAGMSRHFHPGGTWPVTDASKLERRRAWVAEYEAAARRFASCKFLMRIGQGHVHPEAEAVRAIHDNLCDAQSAKPLA